MLAHRYRPLWRLRLKRFASLAVLVPWAALVLYYGSVPAWQSVLQLERFQDTLNPGYFLIRLAVMLLALGVLVQALRDIFHPRPQA